jgi:hypothetical protein
MGTSTGAGCGAHCLRCSFSKCRLRSIRASTRGARRKEGFMAGELGSDDGLKCASGPASEEAILSRVRLRKIRTCREMSRPLQSRTPSSTLTLWRWTGRRSRRRRADLSLNRWRSVMQVPFKSRHPQANDLRDLTERRVRLVLRRLGWLVPRAEVQTPAHNIFGARSSTWHGRPSRPAPFSPRHNARQPSALCRNRCA